MRNEPALRTEPEAERTPCDKKINKAGSKMGKIAVFGNGGRGDGEGKRKTHWFQEICDYVLTSTLLGWR